MSREYISQKYNFFNPYILLKKKRFKWPQSLDWIIYAKVCTSCEDCNGQVQINVVNKRKPSRSVPFFLWRANSQGKARKQCLFMHLAETVMIWRFSFPCTDFRIHQYSDLGIPKSTTTFSPLTHAASKAIGIPYFCMRAE